MRCLWLARALPFPLVAGDRLYSRGLAGALGAAGADVRFIGLPGTGAPEPTKDIEWDVVPGAERGRLRSALSVLPLVAARHATSQFRARIRQLLQEPWDAVIVDHYGMAWAIDEMPDNGPVRVFVAHNHEAGVTARQWRDRTQTPLIRLYHWQNWLKTSRLESRAARRSDVVTTITHADAHEFMHYARGARVIELTPGYDGPRLASRTITPETPRSIVMFGSYRWSAKRASLQQLLEKAAPVLASAGMAIDVVGDIDESFRSSLQARHPTVRFHGFVDDPAPYLQSARMALVAEPVGGGFKLKLLQYLFCRVPIAALTDCASGLPEAIKAELILENDIDELLQRVASEIDDLDTLNARQSAAYRIADDLFNWIDRGRTLMQAIEAVQAARSQSGTHEAPQAIQAAPKSPAVASSR